MTTDATAPALVPDPANVEALLERLASDLGAALVCAATAIGHRLGLFRALARGGPQTPREVAERTGIEERHAREWLCGQAARGYVIYDPNAATFALSPEQAACLADEESPTYIGGALQWLHAYAGAAASRPATSASCLSDMPITAFWPSRSSW